MLSEGLAFSSQEKKCKQTLKELFLFLFFLRNCVLTKFLLCLSTLDLPTYALSLLSGICLSSYLCLWLVCILSKRDA